MLWQLNFDAIVLAAIAWMVIGFIWFDGIFKAKWREASGKAPDYKPGKALIGVAVLALINATVIDVMLTLIEPGTVVGPGWLAGVIVALVMWLGYGFVARVQMSMFYNDSTALFWIDTGWAVVTGIAMGAIVGFWH